LIRLNLKPPPFDFFSLTTSSFGMIGLRMLVDRRRANGVSVDDGRCSVMMAVAERRPAIAVVFCEWNNMNAARSTSCDDCEATTPYQSAASALDSAQSADQGKFGRNVHGNLSCEVPDVTNWSGCTARGGFMHQSR
jgi:hypothetical protein